MKMQKCKFPTTNRNEFFKILRQEVNQYFKENKLSKHANGHMIFKTVFMLCLYFIPYLIIISGLVSSYWLTFLLWMVMAWGMGGIGLSVMHDAIHGAYSKSFRVNKILGYTMNLIGGNAENWRIQHNVLHHSYTNIDGADEDIAPPSILRFSPHSKHYKIQKYQQYYAWFIYALSTFFWSTSKDFVQTLRFRKKGLVKKEKFRKLLTQVTVSKILYHLYILVIPMLLAPVPFWFTIICYLCMHFVVGLVITCVFQPAHVMPECEFPLPDEEGMMENDWAIHQLKTTANFSPKSKLLSWYVGGLNYQIEHHLFPNICHIHYKNISKIVARTAKQFNLPYHYHKTMLEALIEHGKLLKVLGKYERVVMPLSN
jgi:linoleoyl-CoA desaturase